MARPRAKKKKVSSGTHTRSVFLYGSPNAEKRSTLEKLQADYTDAVNCYISLLSDREDCLLQLLKNDKKDPLLRKLKKESRIKALSYASSLLEQAEKNGCIFPKMELSSFKMREVSAMISALKEINKSFKYVQDDAKFEFFDFPAVVKSAENISGESTFVFHYRRIN